MKEQLKEIYRIINQKYPKMGSLMWRLYSRQPFNKIRKKIKGKNNVINYDRSVLSSVVFDIVGNNNKIEIKNSCFLESVIFYIRGNNHAVSIGEGCKFNGGRIWLRIPLAIWKLTIGPLLKMFILQ